jgi:integrase
MQEWLRVYLTAAQEREGAMPMEDKAEEFRGMTLAQALAHVAEGRWKGMRSHSSNMSQARTALDTVSRLARPELGNLPRAERIARVLHHEVRPEHLKAAVREWRQTTLGAVTINRRVVALSVLGYETRSLYTPMRKKLKWWLKPDAQEVLTAKLLAWGTRLDRLMVHYITWATQTGLRVEETLRLTRADFAELPDGRVVMTVPGLKTSAAQATLPLTALAQGVYHSRLGGISDPSARLFPVSYGRLSEKWRECQKVIDVQNNPTATLKALRRNAARNLHVIKGMPLELVRNYLRHENVQTTMGYLRLTGGYGAEEFARYL